MAILDGLGEDAGDEFIIALDQYKKDMLQETGKNETAGISFRWTLGSKKGDPEVLLLAQVKLTYSSNITFLLQREILPVNALNIKYLNLLICLCVQIFKIFIIYI